MIFADDLTGTGLILDLANFLAAGTLTEAAFTTGLTADFTAGFKATFAAGFAADLKTDFDAALTAGFATTLTAGFIEAFATIFFAGAFLSTDFFDLQEHLQFFTWLQAFHQISSDLPSGRPSFSQM